jgi:hypothetical protein
MRSLDIEENKYSREVLEKRYETERDFLFYFMKQNILREGGGIVYFNKYIHVMR